MYSVQCIVAHTLYVCTLYKLVLYTYLYSVQCIVAHTLHVCTLYKLVLYTYMYSVQCIVAHTLHVCTLYKLEYNFPGPYFTPVHVYCVVIGARLHREGPGSARVKNRHHVTSHDNHVCTTCVPSGTRTVGTAW